MGEYRKFEYQNVENDFYQENAWIGEKLFNKIYDATGKNMLEVRYSDVINYFCDHYNIDFVIFNSGMLDVEKIFETHNLKIKIKEFTKVDKVFAEKVDGFTIPDSKKCIVFLNGRLFFPKLIFTILHELSHIYLYKTNKDYLKVFALLASADPTTDYPEELLPYESAANIIASNFYINTPALFRNLATGVTFDELIKKYNISKAALHNRIQDYLLHYLEMNPSIALSALFKYRYEGLKGARVMKRFLLCHESPY